MAENLVITPFQGRFVASAIKAKLESMPDVFLDPYGTKYVFCAVARAMPIYRKRRIRDSSRLLYLCLIEVDDLQVSVIQEEVAKEKLRSARKFLGWLLKEYKCIIRNGRMVDRTEVFNTKGVEGLYPGVPPGLPKDYIVSPQLEEDE